MSKKIIVALSVLTVVALLILSGCAAQKPVSGSMKDLDQYILRASDSNEEDSVTSHDPDESAMASVYAEHVTFNFDKTEYRQDGTGIATVTVIVPDIENVMSNIEGLLAREDLTGKSAEERMEIVTDLFDKQLSGNFQTLTNTVDVDLQKDNDIWRIVPNEELIRTLSGNAEEAFVKYMNQAIRSYVEVLPE